MSSVNTRISQFSRHHDLGRSRAAGSVFRRLYRGGPVSHFLGAPGTGDSAHPVPLPRRVGLFQGSALDGFRNPEPVHCHTHAGGYQPATVQRPCDADGGYRYAERGHCAHRVQFSQCGEIAVAVVHTFCRLAVRKFHGQRKLAGFLSAGLASYFAKAQVALPFLLDLHQIPQDFSRST